MEQFLQQLGLLSGGALPASGGGGMGANNNISQPMFSMPDLTPEQLQQMQIQMGAEMLKEQEQPQQPQPQMPQQQRQQPQQQQMDPLDEILARYGLPQGQQQQQPQPTWGGFGGFRNG